MRSFSLKKWYFDLITADGHVLYLYFIVTRIAGISQGYASAHLTLSGGAAVKSSCHTKPATSEDGSRILFGESFLLAGEESSQIQLRLPRLSIDLRYTPTGDPWTPAGDGMLIRNRNHLLWRVPYAKALVAGRLVVDSLTMEVSGLGYHDFVELTIPPWRLPIAELLWGRAHCGSFSVVYDQIMTKSGDYLQHVLLCEEKAPPTNTVPCGNKLCSLQNASVEGRRFQIKTDPADRVTMLVHDSFNLRLYRRCILEDAILVTDERIKPKLLKHFLIHVTDEARELKMLSEASLHIGDAAIEGLAIHERVSWGQARSGRNGL
jgi:hypothetical protein